MWNLITKEDFDEFEVDTGYVLNDYNFEAKDAPDKANLVCVTSGGFTVSHTKTFGNHGDDVDGINGRFAELEYVQSSDTKISFTALTADAETIALALGCATIDGEKITADSKLKDEHFKPIIWIGKKKGGGLLGVKIDRALSTDGLNLTTSKQGKGTIGIGLTGFKSIENPDKEPIEFYSTAPVDEAV